MVWAKMPLRSDKFRDKQTTLDLTIGLSRRHQAPKKDYFSNGTFTDVAPKLR